MATSPARPGPTRLYRPRLAASNGPEGFRGATAPAGATTLRAGRKGAVVGPQVSDLKSRTAKRSAGAYFFAILHLRSSTHPSSPLQPAPQLLGHLVGCLVAPAAVRAPDDPLGVDHHDPRRHLDRVARHLPPAVQDGEAELEGR